MRLNSFFFPEGPEAFVKLFRGRGVWLATLQNSGGIEGNGLGTEQVCTDNQHVNHGKGEMLSKGSSKTLSSGATHHRLFTFGLLAPEEAHVVEQLILNPRAVSTSNAACFFSKGSWGAWSRQEPGEGQTVLVLFSHYCVK